MYLGDFVMFREGRRRLFSLDEVLYLFGEIIDFLGGW